LHGDHAITINANQALLVQNAESVQIGSKLKIRATKLALNCVSKYSGYTHRVSEVMNKLENKIAVITGGTQGLGEAIANQFAEAGIAGIVTGWMCWLMQLVLRIGVTYSQPMKTYLIA